MLVSKSFFFLLMSMLSLAGSNTYSYAASAPLMSVSAVAPTNTAAVTTLEKPNKQNGKGLFARWKQKLLAKAIQKGWLGEGEMTEKQKRQAKWSMLLGLGSLVLLLVPYVSL